MNGGSSVKSRTSVASGAPREKERENEKKRAIQMERKSKFAICHDRREKRGVHLRTVTDLKSLFIANEITGNGMMTGSTGGGRERDFLFLATSFSRVHAAWPVLK